MPDLSFLLVLVMALATGLLAAIAVANQTQTTGSDFYRHYLTNLLLFNLLILSGMVYAVLGQASIGSLRTALPVLLVVMAVLKLGWLFAYFKTVSQLQGDRRTLSFQRHKWVGAGILAVYTLCLALGWTQNRNTLINLTVATLEFFIITSALLVSLWSSRQMFLAPRNYRRKVNLQFTLFHTVLTALILASMLESFLGGGTTQSKRFLTNGVLLLLFNIFPIFWIPRYRPRQNSALVSKFKHYEITSREQQLVRLIQLGKTNQDIADSLFISVATVKDHNNRIFRKCGVRNRTELANLFSEEIAIGEKEP